MSQWQDFDIFAGENRTLTMYARDPDNNPQDLTGKSIQWRVGNSLWNDQIQPMLQKDGTIVNATAGTFTVTILPPDTMPFSGDFLHQAITVTDGSLEWINNNGDEIVFVNDDGDGLLFVNDFDDNNHVVTTGTLHIRRSFLQF